MKKSFLVPLAIVLVSSLILAACAAPAPAPPAPAPAPAPVPVPAPAPAPAPKPAPAPTPAPAPKPAPAKPVEISMSWTTGGLLGNVGLPTWAKNVEKATEGKVKVTTYPAGVLGGPREAYQQVATGVVDISWQFVAVYESSMPLLGVMMLPLVVPSVPNISKISSRVTWDLYNKFPEIRAHFRDVKVLLLHSSSPSIVCTTKKKITTRDDLKGLKVRSAGGAVADWLVKMGASAMAIPLPDVYGALQTGVVQGALASWEAVTSQKLDEVLKLYLDEGVSGTSFFLIMNQDRWNSFPPDIQKAIDSVSGYAGAEYLGEVLDQDNGVARKKLAERPGVESNKLAPDELARWQAVAQEINQKWIADMKAKGLPGQAVYDETLRLMKEYVK